MPTGTVTFLFTDIEGSTRLLNDLREAYATILGDQRAILRAAFAKWNGQEIDTQGDAFFAVFPRAVDAIAAVVDAQRALAAHLWPAGAAVRVRMALHTGEPAIGPTGYVGIDVHRAARIVSAGHGGQALISAATRGIVENELPAGVSLKDLGEHRLKDLQKPERIYQLVIPDLPSDFPALKSLDALPNNLPIQLTSFVGREEVIAEVKRMLLASNRLLTLTGTGGTGKTRLSLQVAAELLDIFDHGVWFSERAPLADPDLIPQTILSAIGISEQPNKTPLEILKEYLHEKKSLIVLDNCEHLITASAQVANALLNAAPGLKILASSREALGVKGELSYP
ncbi:MAG TPA: adenylate/guanylate cyclase domain-containing protein, partial [Anaerolineae bacterium]